MYSTNQLTGNPILTDPLTPGIGVITNLSQFESMGMGDFGDFLTGSGSMLLLVAIGFGFWVMTGPSKEKRQALSALDKEYKTRRKRIKDEYGPFGLTKVKREKRDLRTYRKAKEEGWLA